MGSYQRPFSGSEGDLDSLHNEHSGLRHGEKQTREGGHVQPQQAVCQRTEGRMDQVRFDLDVSRRGLVNRGDE